MCIWHIYAKNSRCCNRREDRLPWPGQFFLVCYSHFLSSLVFSITHHVTLNAILQLNAAFLETECYIIFFCVCVYSAQGVQKLISGVSFIFCLSFEVGQASELQKHTCLSVPCASLQTLLPLGGTFSNRS